MVLNKWRQRRRSFRELRRREAELYAEYLKMRQHEIDLKAGLAVAEGLERSGYGLPQAAPGITVQSDEGSRTSSF